MSLSTKILIGMGLGILSGFFFGEEVAFLKVPGDAFILLLQMTVLPYIMVSLIAGLGSLSLRQAGALARRGGLVLLLLWAIGLLMVLLMPLAFPKWEMASYFSTSLIEKRPPANFLGLYIPSNLQYRQFIARDLSRQYPPATVYNSSLPPPMPHEPGKSRLQEIGDRGYVRVGYVKDALPFAFVNQEGKLVGFDVELAYAFAQAMKVQLEMVLLERERAAAMLNAGYVDLIMSGVAVTIERAQEMAFSASYMDQALAFVVKDYRREDFSSRDKVKSLEKVKLGVPNVPYYIAKVKDYLPQAEVVVLASPREFFTGKEGNLDALVFSAEAGSAWSLVYPAYTVAVPYPDVLAVPTACAAALDNRDLVDFLNTWIELKKKDETVATLYDYWILGQNAVEKAPRWSVIRNVLHLVS